MHIDTRSPQQCLANQYMICPIKGACYTDSLTCKPWPFCTLMFTPLWYVNTKSINMHYFMCKCLRIRPWSMSMYCDACLFDWKKHPPICKTLPRMPLVCAVLKWWDLVRLRYEWNQVYVQWGRWSDFPSGSRCLFVYIHQTFSIVY